jgi:uncharacterized Zn finger protein
MAKKTSSPHSTFKKTKLDPPITEADIQHMAEEKVFDRGESYFEGGAIIKPTRIGNTLLARCHGSDYAPYRVKVVFDKKKVVEATCTCPYDWGGYCKHIVALLLTHIRAPEMIEVKPIVEELLVESDRNDLIAMITEMVDLYPELYGVVDGSGLDEEEEDDLYDEDDEW